MKNTKKLFTGLVAVFFIALLFFVRISPLLADNSLWGQQSGMGTDSGQIGSAFGDINKETDLKSLVVNIIKILLSILGLFFTVLIILAGFRWMNSRGNEDEVSKAKSQLLNSIIGIIIIIAAYAITIFVISMTESALKGEI
ncbi:MAG: hypothetical protein US83_C0017G0022 [Candidatus Falkowbacteria bacterium GW2011_GWC2_38_22]|uniref:Uncharacterized protein n=1 Tax=Candidatus Falkowbacteria bacterium GW2011_GWE1_38_31 TaxID=1618638 RepID=A0A0G0M778_9BACT|nr:MAG: hypothetical protein US73_C0015G0022 [Candidatus Falkowbacteria bacterium GW2011_GWF2_38_1205]KKQ60500.1 MAG: hypothetical protein US83_C0017G0022 [Candidatus Falkowbacteria bacterium GW2011_GWC2_38_22]KKQ62598.1 MAG: hypothetical protein US84_C0014G0022 [Candidatus Falkowbacteria bacterium GW2011_GWF1_38_22]KKQ64645.1 MAG: hypothetical protein US87_C0014G0022 [Candidatus Falkowbacteria bacterium GW2011_GWE2_38_254]KKQ69554.1 MAG: hypothetical protein US91_C0013G0022 [Candidatus Falkowb